jgi:hypothetical protein
MVYSSNGGECVPGGINVTVTWLFLNSFEPLGLGPGLFHLSIYIAIDRDIKLATVILAATCLGFSC